MKECIHVLVRVNTSTSDIYDHNAICDRIRNYLNSNIEKDIRDKDRSWDGDHEWDFLKDVDRVEVL